MANSRHAKPLLFSQKYSKLFLFLTEEGFSKHNLDQLNSYYVTPLTLAIDSKAANRFVNDLLELGANPALANGLGYTPLQLAQQNPAMLATIKKALRQHTSPQIKCEEGSTFTHKGEIYKVTVVIRGGSASLKVLEIQNINSGESSILKVKHTFSGLELRNYILLNKYEDFFPIKYFCLGEQVFSDVYGLKQKIVAGQRLSLAISSQVEQTAKDHIIYQAIIALCRLHKRGLVHRDALPNNCHWDQATRRAEFLDYDIMRTDSDLASNNFQKSIIYDFKRLILGCITRTNSRIKGVSDYTPNIDAIIERVPDNLMDPRHKSKIHAEIAQGLDVSTTGNIRVHPRVNAR